MKTYTDYNGNTVEYGYDELGNRISLTYPGGEIVRYEYDGNGRMTSVTDPNGRVTAYTYDGNGRLIKTSRPNGTSETRSYDAAGRLVSQTDAAADGTSIHQLTYTYDGRGNIAKTTGINRGDLSTIQNAVMTYDADNRLVTYNGEKVTYDADGNMTYGPLDGQMASFTYDCRNRLNKVETADGSEICYEYDAENNRIGENDGETKKEYVIDPQATYSQLLESTQYSKNLLGFYTQEESRILYTYGLGLVSGTGEDGTVFYHFNNIGSTTEITDEAGVVQYRIAYGTYGELTGVYDSKGIDITTTEYGEKPTVGEGVLKFLYNGQLGVQTDTNGLYYMRARYYNTDIKRFINRDVVSGDITNSQSLNRYSYVQGNPVSLTDPFGLSPMGDSTSLFSQIGHTLLDIAGFVWDGFDLINAAWYFLEGNTLMAMTCMVAAVPFVGSVVSNGIKVGFKGSKFAAKAIKAADYVYDGAKLLGYTGQMTFSVIDTMYAVDDYRRASANGNATLGDGLNVGLNLLATIGSGITAIAAGRNLANRMSTDGVGDAVKAAMQNLGESAASKYNRLSEFGSNTMDNRLVSNAVFNSGERIATTSQIRNYKKQMKSKGINVVVDKKGKFLNGNKAAGFNYSTGTVYIKKQAGVIDLYHEGFHAEQYLAIGQEKYQNIGRLAREEYVYSRIIDNSHIFNEYELNGALEYIKKLRGN